ncbi:RNA helicase family protein [Bacteroides fragilis str. J-143-4]|uniref:primase-helicase family protein n=1 Tax=Bacteroides fragilis TaxID=817 RepID=UPI0004472582|nr:primase-helicase family protein [Bacteroides fragilis]EXZ17455.1 RNA helicase family protein [Bacteroides fragilis str. J-143-4]
MKEEEYMRVGTTLYKVVNQPCANGGYEKKRVVWNNSTLRQDYGKNYLATVPKYDGFCTVPNHLNYKKEIGGFLNFWEPIEHKPQQGDFSHIQSLMRHIFGEQYELGMDYMQLLYLQPTQKLPIVLLVSEERNTGKSTFLNFLKVVFENNVTFNTNEDFRSQFNSNWAGKLLIVVDEVLLNRREDSERLKNLSTTFTYKVEAKGKDRTEIAFFAKFVLCSNNEYLPILIDAGETRYWVRKIMPLQSDDTNFLQKLKAEIPAFLYFLTQRELSTTQESRMWFNPRLTHTAALQKIIRSNRNRLEIEMTELLLDIMSNMNVESVSFCLNDLVTLLLYSQVKVEKHQVRKVVQEVWKLTSAHNSLSYTAYEFAPHRECHYEPKRKTGRFYTVTKEQLTAI